MQMIAWVLWVASMNWAKTTARRDEKHLCLGLGAAYIRELTVVDWLPQNEDMGMFM